MQRMAKFVWTAAKSFDWALTLTVEPITQSHQDDEDCALCAPWARREKTFEWRNLLYSVKLVVCSIATKASSTASPTGDCST